MKRTKTKPKVRTYLAYTWELESEVDNLPEGKLKQTLKMWQSFRAIAYVLPIDSLAYRNNLQHVLDNQDCKEVIESLEQQVAQLIAMPRNQFKTVFGVELSSYQDFTGFDVIRFDEEVIKSSDNCMSDTIREQYGQDAVDLIEGLLI